MDTLSELRELADDLADLGDGATAARVRQAIDRFSAWKFDAGERLLERARARNRNVFLVTDRSARYPAKAAVHHNDSRSGRLLAPETML